jgi:hypothetical protein
MRAKFVNEAYGMKDKVRMQDIRTKSAGDHSKEISLATTQAKIIKDASKAKARAEAAEEVFGQGSDIAQIFGDRAAELGGSYVKGKASSGTLAPVKEAPPKGDKLEREYKTEFILPSERVKGASDNKPSGGSGFRRGMGSMASLGVGRYSEPVEWEDDWKSSGWRRKGSPILPLGKVNLGSGESKLFNVFDTWGKDGDMTAELWKVQDWGSSKPKLKMIFTSVPKPSYKLGNRTNFMHDQTHNPLFDGQLIDYAPLQYIGEFGRKYGVSSIWGYVYK